MDAVVFRQVSFAHGGTQVLRDVTLTIAAGEVLALVGTSGAGKTTALRMVNRMLVPDSGDVLVQGRDTRAWDPIRLRRSIGYIIQDVGLFPHLTVGENIGIVPRLEGWTEARTAERVRDLLELVELPAATFAPRYPDELSGGQRQRIGVARALAVDPPILLMDEPFGALDPVTRRQLQHAVLRIQGELRKTIIIVTHDLPEAMTLADRVAVMDAGRVIWSGAPQALDESSDERIVQLLDAARPHLAAKGRPA